MKKIELLIDYKNIFYLLKFSFILLFIFNSIKISGQTIYNLSVSNINLNEVNINLKTYTSTQPSYLVSDSHTVTNGVINMILCYSAGLAQSPTIVNNNISIPVENNTNYTLNIELYLMNNNSICDYLVLTDSESFNFSTPINGTITLPIINFKPFKEDIEIYPNPVSEKLYINNNDILIYKIQIFNILGEKVKTFTNNFENIYVSNLKNGIYFVIFNTEIGYVNKKIIIKN